MDLVPRLFDPQEGEILLDGVPIRDLDHRRVAARNRLRATGKLSVQRYHREQFVLRRQATSATANGRRKLPSWTETIKQFPGGYERCSANAGSTCRGARSSARRWRGRWRGEPSIVLLDDALSAVDTHTEAEILRSLRETLSGRTALIASHRVSAIRDASWIIVLDEGRIVEQGKHAELLAAGGRYWALLNRQQLEESIEVGGLSWQRTRNRRIQSAHDAAREYGRPRPRTLQDPLHRTRARRGSARQTAQGRDRSRSPSCARATRSRRNSSRTSRTICERRSPR